MKERGRKVLALGRLNLDNYVFNLRPASLVSFILVLLIRTAGRSRWGLPWVWSVEGEFGTERQPRSVDMTDRISPLAGPF